MSRYFAIAGIEGVSFISDVDTRQYSTPAGRVSTTTSTGGGASTGLIKVWTGSAWVEKPVKVWTGSAWVAKPLKVWNGTAWVLA
jgi:hypothetical protein